MPYRSSGIKVFMSDTERAHCNVDNDYSNELPLLRVAEGGRFLKLSFARSEPAEWNSEMFYRRGVRGKCKGFSFGSRRRMLDRLNQVSCAAALPTFVTMTLPDDSFHDCVGEFAKRAKCWLDTFQKRLLRVCPEASGFWRIEWKARLSGLHEGKLFPHFHLLIWGLPVRVLGEQERYDDSGSVCEIVPIREPYLAVPDMQLPLQLLDLWSDGSRARSEWRCRIESVSTGRVFAGGSRFVNRARDLENACVCAGLPDAGPQWGERARQMSFQDWASLAWYHVVGSHNLDHVQAGVRVESLRSWGGVASYAAKYLSKADAEFMGGIEWGRSWGIFNRVAMPWAKMLEIQLDNEVGVRLRRVARHYLERRLGRRLRKPYGITLYCDTEGFRRLWEYEPPPF